MLLIRFPMILHESKFITVLDRSKCARYASCVIRHTFEDIFIKFRQEEKLNSVNRLKTITTCILLLLHECDALFQHVCELVANFVPLHEERLELRTERACSHQDSRFVVSDTVVAKLNTIQVQHILKMKLGRRILQE